MAEVEWEVAEHMNLGRNGLTKSHGIQVQRVFDEIWLQPINSRGDITRCRIVIPVDQVVDVIAALTMERLRT